MEQQEMIMSAFGTNLNMNVEFDVLIPELRNA